MKLNDKFSYLKEGDVIIIENIRFYKEEEDNDESFSKKLASLGEIYINDAFSCSHRKQSSIHNITKFIDKSFCRSSFKKKEINPLILLLKNKKSQSLVLLVDQKFLQKLMLSQD